MKHIKNINEGFIAIQATTILRQTLFLAMNLLKAIYNINQWQF
jgi:hypothetical protein